MKKTFTICCSIAVLIFMNSHVSRADIKITNEFLRGLKESGMIFEPPRTDYDSVAVRENKDMRYDLAIRSKAYNLEIRYAIRHMPNEEWPLLYFRSVIANIVQGDDPFHVPYHEFTDVSDSNADWGATAVFPAKPSFASPFDSCNVVYIHKDDRGDAFIMYLFNKKDFNMVFPEMERMFYVLRFK